MNDEKYIEIVEKHTAAAAQAIDAEIKAEEAKSAEQKEAEKLTTELRTLSASMQMHQKFPTRYAAELKAEEARMGEITSRLDALQGKPQPNAVGSFYAY